MPNPKIGELGRATQFPINRQNHTKKGPYFKPAFEKLLKDKYPMQDPNGKLVNMQGVNGVALAVIWEALRGDIPAAREIMDRVDGKQIDTEEHKHFTFNISTNGYKPQEGNLLERLQCDTSRVSG